MPDLPYQWDDGVQRWRNIATGRFVSPQIVRDALEGAIDAAEQRMLAMAAQLITREISRAQWQQLMVEEIKDLHISAARAAGGPELSQQQWGAVGAQLRQQYTYLARLGAQLASGDQRLDAVFLVRVGMYAHAARGMFEVMRGIGARAIGMTLEWNERGAKDSCADCIRMERLGRVPIGTLIPIGRRRCLTRCRCLIHYSRTGRVEE